MMCRAEFVLLLLATCISATAAAEPYEFSPDGEFTVVFPANPSLGEYETFEGTQCRTKYAALVLWDGSAGLRAESMVCRGYDEQAINKEIVFEIMKQHALASGVSGIALEYKDDASGKTGTYRGEIRALGNTYVVVMVFGRRSAITLAGSAPFTDFPNLGFNDFVRSLRRIGTGPRSDEPVESFVGERPPPTVAAIIPDAPEVQAADASDDQTADAPASASVNVPVNQIRPLKWDPSRIRLWVPPRTTTTRAPATIDPQDAARGKQMTVSTYMLVLTGILIPVLFLYPFIFLVFKKLTGLNYSAISFMAGFVVVWSVSAIVALAIGGMPNLTNGALIIIPIVVSLGVLSMMPSGKRIADGQEDVTTHSSNVEGRVAESNPTNRKQTPASTKSTESAYAQAWDELESGNFVKGLWAQCFAEAGGEDERARATYLEKRSHELSGKPKGTT